MDIWKEAPSGTTHIANLPDGSAYYRIDGDKIKIWGVVMEGWYAPVGDLPYDLMRIATPEQLAAEKEREEAIDDLEEFLQANTTLYENSCHDIADIMVKAGYRKQLADKGE